MTRSLQRVQAGTGFEFERGTLRVCNQQAPPLQLPCDTPAEGLEQLAQLRVAGPTRAMKISATPGNWNAIALFNPVAYLISGFRWSSYNSSDVDVAISLAAMLGFLLLCLTIVWWIFRTGYRLKN
jgi:hypothetical protein